MADSEEIIDQLFAKALALDADARAKLIDSLPSHLQDKLKALLEADSSAEAACLFEPVVNIRPDPHLEKTLAPGSDSQSRVTTPNVNIDDPEQIGRYKVHNKIAQGGMGIVYLATDPQLNRKVAIKLLTHGRHQDDEWLKRFRSEARFASALNHPNILTVHEIGESNEADHGGLPYIATEYVAGITLRQILAADRLPIPTAIDYASQLISGIAAAHSAGIIHRDLKPDNIMVRKDGLLKILDFGLAKGTAGSASNSDSTPSVYSETGAITGTISYMSPEQARGQDLSISTDVFSFGIVFFQMLTGEKPFTGESPSDVTAAILTRAPKSASDSGLQLPPDLVRLVHQCLSKDATHRPNAEQIIEALKEHERQHDASAVAVESSAEPTPVPQADTSAFALESTDQIFEQELEIRYAQSGDVNIAWQQIGDGPIDLVFVMGWVSHIEWFWKDPGFAAFLRRLATFSRVILFDKRGTGLSDKVPVNELPTLELRMDDVRAVMDAAGSQQAVLCGVSEGGPLCTLFAATYPEKTIAITMIGCYARRLWADDYPWGPTAEQREVFLQEIASNWGGPLGIEDRAPTKANDPAFRKWWASYLRMGASPGAAVALTKMNAQIDVRPILPSIQVPTLVIHRTGDRCLLVEEGRHMADLIPGAKFVELPGDDHLPFVGDSDSIVDEIEEFLTGHRTPQLFDRVLATVLSIWLEDANGAADPEDSALQFSSLVEREAKLFRGQNLTVSSCTVELTFDGPARAVRAASAVVGLADRLKINVRCGVDTGICDVGQDTIQGPAAENARQIAEHASLGGVLVSEALYSLVSGSGLDFVEQSIAVNAADGKPGIYQLVR